MRKLILGMTVTADGFVCGPNYESDWVMRTRDESVKEWIAKSVSDAGVHIMGRCSFEAMASYYPTSIEKFAEPMNRIPKVVFSNSGFAPRASYGDTTKTISPHASTWAEAAVATDLVSGVMKLKEQDGKPVFAHGGARFAQDLVKHRLVDEFRLSIHPVVIGKGISVFATTPQLMDLRLMNSTPFASGVVINSYEMKTTK